MRRTGCYGGGMTTKDLDFVIRMLDPDVAPRLSPVAWAIRDLLGDECAHRWSAVEAEARSPWSVTSGTRLSASAARPIAHRRPTLLPPIPLTLLSVTSAVIQHGA